MTSVSVNNTNYNYNMDQINESLENTNNCTELPIKIVDYLYLGSYANILQKYPQNNNIGCIINVASECSYTVDDVLDDKLIDANTITKINYFKYDLHDDSNQNIFMYFNEIVEIIDEYIRRKIGVFVHCYAGKSRSASFIIAYLVKKLNMSLSCAYDFISVKRDIYPNVSFVEQLMKYERFTHDLTKSTFDFDKYVIDMIYNIFVRQKGHWDKSTIKKVYESNDKSYMETIKCLTKLS